jgi:methylenetetrahydrofolate dehydrogenase (NADP+)/methenyltetrahydrofolate cyclohydrolase
MKIDGKQIAQEILDNLKKQTKKLKEKHIYPKLAIILVGNDPSSVSYINQKKIKAELIEAKTIIKHFPSDTSTTTLLKAIKEFNDDGKVHGIIVQQPLPKHINLKDIVNAIDPKKDVDGFHQNSHFQMPINMAVLKILEKVYVNTPNLESRFIDWLKDKKIVILGKGKTGGKPIIKLFERMKIPVASIDSKTEEPENLTQNADIVISAVGKANILKPQMIKEGVALIGIGISRGKSAKLMGDYDQSEVKNIASFYTPTPGGIGPINVTYLLKNLVQAAEKFDN